MLASVCVCVWGASGGGACLLGQVELHISFEPECLRHAETLRLDLINAASYVSHLLPHTRGPRLAQQGV